MLLCDIGNTSYHFYEDGRAYKESTLDFNPATLTQKIYYICVNAEVNKKLQKLQNWIDISSFVDKTKYYESMGIDRIFAVEAVAHGVVIDAGSAITVDVIRNGLFEGGYISAGVGAIEQTYKNISSALAYSINFECDFAIMPKNSRDAISYGFLKGLYLEVESHKLPILLTGGDAQKLKQIFPDAQVNEMLLFEAMQKIIKKANIC